MRRNDIPILLTAALVFADATIVTLALPNLLVDLNTSVYGVAAVLAVYTAVLGCTALIAPRLLRTGSYAWIGVGALCLFSLACAGCALADGIAVLLVSRAVQGFAGALVLTVAGAALAPPQRAGRAWVSIAVLSAALRSSEAAPSRKRSRGARSSSRRYRFRSSPPFSGGLGPKCRRSRHVFHGPTRGRLSSSG
jgi:MFS family permease